MLYIAQVIVYTGILYTIYILFLRNRPMHGFNRAYLLGITLLPVAVPFIKLPALTAYFEGNSIANVRLPEIVINQVQPPTANSTISLLWLVYAMVVLLMILLFAVRWMKLRSVIKSSERVEEKGHTLLLNTQYGPGSWGQYILLPDDRLNETVIEHEAAHVRLKHTRDIILLNAIQCLFWPNLFLSAIKRELKQLHEFQADAAVAMGRQQYSELLLSNVFNTCSLPLTHSFNIHPIKRRIMMLNKKNSKVRGITMSTLTIVAATAFMYSAVALQSCKPKKWEIADKEMTADTKTSSSKGVRKVAEIMPQFPGNIAEYMSSHIVYPEDAKLKGKEGMVPVSFIVREDGSITDVEVKRLVDKATGAPIDQSLLDAATEVVRTMPKWTPGEDKGEKVAVQYIIPIAFKLTEQETGAATGANK